MGGNLSVIIWFIIFIIFFSIELSRKEIFFIYLAIASLISGVISIFVKDIEIQIVVFIMTSLVSTIFIKIIFDKMIDVNLKFNHYHKYNEDRFCIVLKEDDKSFDSYKVISKSGIYTAKAIRNNCIIRKFKIYSILHDDGRIIIIKWFTVP